MMRSRPAPSVAELPTNLNNSKAHARPLPALGTGDDPAARSWNEYLFDVVVGRVEFVVGWVPRAGGVQDLGGHSEALEDGVGGRRIVDGGDHSHPTVTLGALLQVDGECPVEEERPSEATGDRIEQAIKQPSPVADLSDPLVCLLHSTHSSFHR